MQVEEEVKEELDMQNIHKLNVSFNLSKKKGQTLIAAKLKLP